MGKAVDAQVSMWRDRSSRSPRPVGPVALLEQILAGTPKLPGAQCRDHADIFDLRDDTDTAAAAAICRTCPALAACRTWACSRGDAYGVLAPQVFVNGDADELSEWLDA